LAQFALKQIFLDYLGEPTGFLERHPHPWLVLSSDVRKKEDLSLRTTLYNLDGRPVEGTEPPTDPSDLLAVEVAKREINAFGLGITVGRTRNNDVVINDERISRFHAFFQARDGAWVLSDAGSKNGTFVDANKLDPRKPCPLPDRAMVDFGGYRARFFLPGSFAEFLRKTAPRGPARTS